MDIAGEKKERILWIDFAKVLGIWLVCLGHSYIPEFAHHYIYSFHMPLFFFISGYLEKRRTIKESLINGLKVLILPYTLLYLIVFIPWVPSRIVFHPELFENQTRINVLLISPFLGLISGIGIPIENATVIFGAAWFLAALFYTKMLHSVLFFVLKGNRFLYLLCNVPMLLLAVILRHYRIACPLYINNVLMAFPFFSAGYFLKTTTISNKNLLIMKQDSFLKFVILVSAFLTGIFLSFYNGEASIGNYGKNIVVYYLAAVMGILVVITVSSFYKQRCSVISILSSGTIFIMAFEGPFMGIVLRLSKMQYQALDVIILGGAATIALLLTVIPIKFVQKYIPIIMGGRKSG